MNLSGRRAKEMLNSETKAWSTKLNQEGLAVPLSTPGSSGRPSFNRTFMVFEPFRN